MRYLEHQFSYLLSSALMCFLCHAKTTENLSTVSISSRKPVRILHDHKDSRFLMLWFCTQKTKIYVQIPCVCIPTNIYRKISNCIAHPRWWEESAMLWALPLYPHDSIKWQLLFHDTLNGSNLKSSSRSSKYREQSTATLPGRSLSWLSRSQQWLPTLKMEHIILPQKKGW